MAGRQNALSELTRFWLEGRHGCFVRESVPVPVPYGQSDIDFMALRPDGSQIQLPTGDLISPRVIVECKDEHDFDPKGTNFGKHLLADIEAMDDCRFVASDHPHKVGFSMLKQQHFEVASRIFGSDEFDRVFVVHALADGVRRETAERLRQKGIFWLTVHEILADLRAWYEKHERPAGLRYTLTGDLFHLLFGYCRLTSP